METIRNARSFSLRGKRMPTALWKRIDTKGHDAAVLSNEGARLRLEGMAQFSAVAGPVSVSYQIISDETGATESACIEGHDAAGRFAHRIVRDRKGWRLDGRSMGLAHLLHLDLGFTPATNALQILRDGPRVRHSAPINAVWFDIGQTRLTELPQHYRRRDRLRYDYDCPTVPYSGTLEIESDGFIRRYPGLWQREA